MAVDPGVDFSDNNQESQQPNAAVNQATLVKLVEGLESELLKIKDKVYCLEEKITFLEKENKQLENMWNVVKTFFYDTESFNEFMFNYVKNYEFLLNGLKGYKAENLTIFKNYKDFLIFKRTKNYQEQPQPFNPVQQQPFNPGQHSYPSSGFWQGSQQFNTGSQNFGDYNNQYNNSDPDYMAVVNWIANKANVSIMTAKYLLGELIKNSKKTGY